VKDADDTTVKDDTETVVTIAFTALSPFTDVITVGGVVKLEEKA
jgi:hypothetical protein